MYGRWQPPFAELVDAKEARDAGRPFVLSEGPSTVGLGLQSRSPKSAHPRKRTRETLRVLHPQPRRGRPFQTGDGQRIRQRHRAGQSSNHSRPAGDSLHHEPDSGRCSSMISRQKRQPADGHCYGRTGRISGQYLSAYQQQRRNQRLFHARTRRPDCQSSSLRCLAGHAQT